MLSAEQIAANRKSASQIIKIRLGLDQTINSDWTYEQRVQYDKALAAYIFDHPAAFSDTDLYTAQTVKNTDYAPLSDPSFSFSDFGSEVVNNGYDLIGKPLVNLGKSASSAFNFLGNVGPWLAVGGALFVAYMFIRAKGKQVSQ